MLIRRQAYTILESSTKSVFVHVTIQEPPGPAWGDILKSNSNGTYFGVSIENVRRNSDGYIDFEKMIGLDGIALVNIISNPQEATINRKEDVQTRITHNDGKYNLNYISSSLTLALRWYLEASQSTSARFSGQQIRM